MRIRLAMEYHRPRIRMTLFWEGRRREGKRTGSLKAFRSPSNPASPLHGATLWESYGLVPQPDGFPQHSLLFPPCLRALQSRPLAGRVVRSHLDRSRDHE